MADALEDTSSDEYRLKQFILEQACYYCEHNLIQRESCAIGVYLVRSLTKWLMGVDLWIISGFVSPTCFFLYVCRRFFFV